MPSISEFFGITIYIYYVHGRHNAPYFHARYQGSDASFSIETGEVFAGSLPSKVIKLIQEWTERHRSELLENWERVQKHEIPFNIKGADHD